MKLALETSDNYIIATDLVEETIGKLTTAATQEDAADFKGNSFEALMGIMVTKLRDRKRKKFQAENLGEEDVKRKEGFGDEDADLSEGEKERIMQEELETVVLNRCMEKVKDEMKDQARQFKGKLDVVDSNMKTQF